MPRLFKKHPLTVFRVVQSDQLTLETGESPCDKLRRAAFKNIADGNALSLPGVVVMEDYRSVDFGPANTEFGEYVVFSVRQDERKVPASALQLAVDDALEAEMERVKELGKNYISRDRKREIKQQIKLRLEAKVPPTPKVADAWWNTSSGLVFLTGKAKGTREALSRLFEIAFGPRYALKEMNVMDIFPGITLGTANDFAMNFMDWVWNNGSARRMPFGDEMILVNVGDKVVVQGNGDKLTFSSEGMCGLSTEIHEALSLSKRIVQLAIETGEDIDDYARIEIDTQLSPILSVSVPTVTHHDEEEFDGALYTQIGNVERAYERFLRMLVQFAAEKNREALLADTEVLTAASACRDWLDKLREEGATIEVSLGEKEAA